MNCALASGQLCSLLTAAHQCSRGKTNHSQHGAPKQRASPWPPYQAQCSQSHQLFYFLFKAQAPTLAATLESPA